MCRAVLCVVCCQSFPLDVGRVKVRVDPYLTLILTLDPKTSTNTNVNTNVRLSCQALPLDVRRRVLRRLVTEREHRLEFVKSWEVMIVFVDLSSNQPNPAIPWSLPLLPYELSSPELCLLQQQ